MPGGKINTEKAKYNKGYQVKKYKKAYSRKPKYSQPRAGNSTAPARLGQSPGDVGLQISNSSEAYLHGMANPASAPACGMPIGGIPSEKNKCWARGRMSTGTNGIGYILGVPSNIAANNINCAFVTGPAFAGTTISNTVVANSVIAVNSNSPYSYAAYSSTTLKARFVCGEIRVRYIGTELNRGGDAVVYCDTNHNNLVGYSEAQLLGYAAAGRSFINMQEWISCKYNGVVDPIEENFVTDPASSVQTKAANACMVVWLNSAVPAQPFDYEVWGHFEVIGSLGANMTTTTPDPVGHTATNSGAQAAQIDHPGSHGEHDYGHSLMGKVFHTIATGASKVGDILSDKGTQDIIKGAIAKYGPTVLKGLTKAAPLLLV